MTEFDKLLRFDGLAEAEKITGKSYKDDKPTEALGMALLLTSNESKKVVELALRDDTYYSIPFADSLRIFQEEGFEEVHSHDIEGTRDVYKVLWHPDGILGTLESYSWSTDGKSRSSTNNAKIYFNLATNSPDIRKLPVSGHNKDGHQIGYIDAREGFRHYLGELRGLGSFTTPWIERPWLWLVDYQQPKEAEGDTWTTLGVYYKSITQAVIETLPLTVQRSITPDV